MNKASTTNVFYLKKTTSSECDNGKQFGISKEVIKEFFEVPITGNTNVEFIGSKSLKSFQAEIQTATDPRLGQAGIRDFFNEEGGVNTGDYILFTKLGYRKFLVKIIKQDTDEYKTYGKLFISDNDKHAGIFTDSEIDYENKKSLTPTQTIYYGVPGSGKSHKIDEETKGLTDEQKIRVVFHPEYTNADFVGQILPKVKNGSVEYEFKPGPFTKILYRAYHNYNTPYCLIIEEINRGNAAAIFGDVFQLLDRIKKGDTPENINGNTFGEGWSKYFVENEFINNYLRSPVEYSKEGFTENHDKKSVTFKSGITFSENTGIRLPPNLSIYATMNTSDQNVFTLDNAFQRRWEMELVQNVVDKKDENGIKQMNAKITVNNQSITWEDFQTQINSIIGKKSNEGGLSSMEDKRLGCWFIKAENGVIDEKHFANKVLKYLWDDAFKFCHQEIFESDIKNFEELQNRFLKTGFDIFSENCGLKNYLSNNQSDSQSQSNPVNPQDSEPSEENSEQ